MSVISKIWKSIEKLEFGYIRKFVSLSISSLVIHMYREPSALGWWCLPNYQDFLTCTHLQQQVRIQNRYLQTNQWNSRRVLLSGKCSQHNSQLCLYCILEFQIALTYFDLLCTSLSTVPGLPRMEYWRKAYSGRKQMD